MAMVAKLMANRERKRAFIVNLRHVLGGGRRAHCTRVWSPHELASNRGPRHTPPMRIAFVFGMILLTGCSREDGNRLARVGRLAGEKVRDAAPARTPFGDLAPESTTAGRVRFRLRTDAALADYSIDVTEGPDGIHLRGQVPHQDHADWAEKLARETVGVSNVVNEIKFAP